MRAIHITSTGGPEAVELVEIPVPHANGGVLVKVEAAGVAFPELLQSRGRYQIQPPLPFVPGAEFAGVVAEAPADSGFKPGDRVAAIAMGGGFAEYAVAPVNQTFPLPDSVSFEAGASFMFNYGTSYFALVTRGRLAAGETVLVHGASGGIGTSAIHIAKAFGAGRVIAVTSTEEKGAVALAAGADEFVLAEGFKDAVLEQGGVDIVVDPVGGDRFTDSLRCLKPEGRLLVIGFTSGDIPDVKVNRLLLNNISVVGVGWGAYEMGHPGTMREQYQAMLPHFADGSLAPVAGPSFDLADAAAAMGALDRREVTGKITLRV
ncbi:MAG: NADPH:quinone oxidoreductase family protein [Aeromicrobium sp.]|nr:MAG: NADPH:quinone oxidoreductase family protein [Aeromicrobium sp.]